MAFIYETRDDALNAANETNLDVELTRDHESGLWGWQEVGAGADAPKSEKSAPVVVGKLVVELGADDDMLAGKLTARGIANRFKVSVELRRFARAGTRYWTQSSLGRRTRRLALTCHPTISARLSNCASMALLVKNCSRPVAVATRKRARLLGVNSYRLAPGSVTSSALSARIEERVSTNGKVVEQAVTVYHLTAEAAEVAQAA
jgi:hypothetical protein